MIDKKALSVMADIMDGIEQTDEWSEIQMNDPGIKAAECCLDSALQKAEAYLPRELYTELSDAHCTAVSAYCDAAILYGMRVSSIIQTVAANSAEITGFLLERREAVCRP